jgi:hypothetical protein
VRARGTHQPSRRGRCCCSSCASSQGHRHKGTRRRRAHPRVDAHAGERLGEWHRRFGCPATWSKEDRKRRERGSRWHCLLKDAVTLGLLVVRPSVFHLLSLRRREEKREVGEESELGFDGERPAQGFCSTGNHARSSDQNERSTSIGL